MNNLAHPELLHLIPLLPCIVGLAMLLYARRRRQAAEALGEAGIVRRLTPADLTAAPNRRIFLVTVAALMLGIALVGPLWGVEPVRGETGDADVVLVLDASNSMRVRDVRPDRLAWEKRTARELLRRLEGSRVGLAIFAGRGYAVSPLTTDFGALNLYLDNLSPDMVTQGGTSLSDAIEQSLGLLMPARGQEPQGSLVVISDGDALEEQQDVLRAANVARRVGVPVSAIGIGTPAGGPIPELDPASGRQTGWKREPTGAVAESRLGEPLLREVARRTGGVYVNAASPNAAAQVAMAARSVPVRARAAGGSAPGNRYEWFAAVALFLLAVDGLLPEHLVRSRRPPRARRGGRRRAREMAS
ncbi:MAG TPA: VWA domain-containing protein [Longimicrobium sp.]|nr:VWA domain-containing protein [Longimicrobium sp.]